MPDQEIPVYDRRASFALDLFLTTTFPVQSPPRYLMDLPAIGSHCALASCNELDLLPIRCRCDKFFCRHHSFPDAHNCTAVSDRSQSTPFDKLQRCALDKCNKPSLEAYLGDSSDIKDRSPATCSRCNLSFCVDHRYPEAHSCTGEIPKPPAKNAAAQALLAKNFPSSSAKPVAVAHRPAQTPTDPKKLAQQKKILLMKTRHRAVPGDPKEKPAAVTVDRRLHLKVNPNEIVPQEKYFWFRKSVGTGRALDSMATQLKISYSDASPLYMCSVSDTGECTPLQNGRQLDEQLEDGATIVFTRSL
ncbi:hypothetical protein PLICRDRAFT_638376 [Plicaturopsis crispa FD-325 SS-3]|nr:hypothetical protein PLICRDRAFT_638376 [Plicaturopsis crispa FD-325 SS-3]